MGSRASWCAKDSHGRMEVFFREQWISSIEELATITKQHLGQFSSRSDLGAGRIMNALVCSANSEGSNITNRIWDSYDNGLIEFDVTNPENWFIYHYKVDEEQIPAKKGTKIAEVTKDGFKWLVSKEKRSSLGEGLS